MSHPQSEYLKSTWYCDSEQFDISQLAKNITQDCSTDTEKAVAIFYWVRDKVLYRVGLWQKRASETVKEGEGTCTNAANLFVALSRAVGIPAGYGVFRVKGRSYFGPVMPPLFRKFINEESIHIYATVYLDGRWLQVDPSDDYDFCKATGYFNPTAKLVDWDGTHDAMLHIDPDDIIDAIWPRPDIDEWMSKKAKNGKGVRALMAGTYVRFLRGNTTPVSSCDDLQPLFVDYLFKNKFYLYVYWQYLRCLIAFKHVMDPEVS